MAENGYHTVDELGEGQKSYEIIRRLKDEEIISPDRGKHNRILLNERDMDVCKDFAGFYKNSDLSLPLSVKTYKQRLKNEKIEELESKLTTRDRRIERLQNKLQVSRKPWYYRPLIKFKRWVNRVVP